MRTVAFHTLGCKVNQVETEKIKEDFLFKGYEIVDFDQLADIYILNTCTVTHVSDRKSRAMLRRAVRKNPLALVVVTGCAAQLNAGQLAEIEGVDLIVGNSQKENLATIIENWSATDKIVPEATIISGPIAVTDKPQAVIYSRPHLRTRAFVKIQDGCQSFCSYCIVPYTRGPVRSKKPEDVAGEIKQLTALGYREIVLTGIHTGMYGMDLPGWNLLFLLKFILETVKGDYRLRLSSLEPLEVTGELIELAACEDRLCRHFHIPLQSGSDRVLKAMNRRYNSQYYNDLVNKIIARIAGVAVTADVMVGFPGEAPEDFEATLGLLEGLEMMNLHVFKYSPRPGTPAAEFDNQVSAKLKQARSDELISLAKKKQQGFIKGIRGQELTLVVEREIGTSRYQGLSDNYLEVEFSSSEDCRGKLVRILADNIDNTMVHGKLLAVDTPWSR
ncbi:MAG: tRNA (N(6)-L-threonylcarbamoyladenosine(37)-C(2))-methylthiotransferase MtaB [Syntrophomonas sp.]